MVDEISEASPAVEDGLKLGDEIVKFGTVEFGDDLLPKLAAKAQTNRGQAVPVVVKRQGSILSGGGSVPAPKASAETWVNMVNEFQKGALSTRLGIPMLYAIDAIHGHSNVYGATIFPHNVGLGVTRDPELVKKIGAATALEVGATGIPYTFTPCIAVFRDPRWGRCYESYSEDHKIVQVMTEIIASLQGDMPATSRKGIPFVADQCDIIPYYLCLLISAYSALATYAL